MENASKALLMAGSVLMTVIIVSMLMLMVNSLNSYQQASGSTEADELASFNSQYEKYNTDHIIGSDLISLANKVIDYNKRKSSAGTSEIITKSDGTTEVVSYEGQGINYEPMILNISFNDTDYIKNQIWYINNDIVFNKHLFNENNNYSVDTITNSFEINVLSQIEGIRTKYTSDALTKFVSGISRVFIGKGNGKKDDGSPQGIPYDVDNDDDKSKMVEAIRNFNSCYGKSILKYGTDDEINNSWDMLWGIDPLKDNNGKEISENVKDDIYKYYEYVMFSRSDFECTRCEAREDTGRIYKMSFQSTGNFYTGSN